MQMGGHRKQRLRRWPRSRRSAGCDKLTTSEWPASCGGSGLDGQPRRSERDERAQQISMSPQMFQQPRQQQQSSPLESSTNTQSDKPPASQPVLVHTDQLNATSGPLFVHASERRHLASAMSAPREPAAAPLPALWPHLEILNLQLTSSTATLTWTLGALRAEPVTASAPPVRMRRETGQAERRPLKRARAPASRDDEPEEEDDFFEFGRPLRSSEARAGDGEPDEAEEEDDRDKDRDDEKAKAQEDEEARRPRTWRRNKSTTTTTTSTQRPSGAHEFTLEQETLARKAANESAPLPGLAGDILRNQPASVRPSKAGQTGQASGTPRRPPIRHHLHVHQANATAHRNHHHNHGHRAGQRERANMTLGALLEASQPSPTAASSPSQSSTTVAPTARETPAPQPVKQTATAAKPRAKSLWLDAANSISATSTSTTSTTSTTTTSTSTSTTSTTTSTTPAPLEHDTSESSTKWVAELPASSANASATTSTTSTITTTSTSRPAVTLARGQLVTAASQRPPERPAEAAGAPAERAQSQWLVRLRRFGSNEVDVVRVVAELWGGPEEARILRRITFKQLEPASGYELCVESASANQLISDKLHILNANHYLKCSDVAEVQLAAMAAAPAPADEPATRRQMRTRTLCREFSTLAANSSDPLNLDGGQWELAGQQEGESATSLRKAKALAGELAPLRSHVELMEITGRSDEPRLFEMSSSAGAAGGSRGGRSPALVASGSAGGSVWGGANESATSLLLPAAGTPLLMDGYSLLPIVACVFLLVLLATVANMLLNLVHCHRPRASALDELSSLRKRLGGAAARRTGSARRPLEGRLAGAGSVTLKASSARLGFLQAALSPGGQSCVSNGSELSNSSRSRMMLVGSRTGAPEPFASSASYFDIPSAAAGDFRHFRHYGSPVARRPGAKSATPTGRPPIGSPHGQRARSAAASAYLLSSDARFPLGPSFEGDERHNADMVGLARRNYDNFITNIYNADHLASELSNAQLNSARNGRHHRQLEQRDTAHNELLVQAHMPSSFSHPHEPADEQRRYSRTAPAKQQRLRFDKVNPIYNMDGIQQLAEGEQEPGDGQLELAELAAGGQRSPASSSASASTSSGSGVATASTGLELEQQPAAGSALDRQKQRFQAQQQQLGRVLSKSGSLVPQPFIKLLADERRAPDSFVFGDQLAEPPAEPLLPLEAHEPAPAAHDRERSQTPPTPPSPLSPDASRPATPRQPDERAAQAPAPLVVLQLGARGITAASTMGAETIDKNAFDQRRSQLASKLHLAGMARH